MGRKEKLTYFAYNDGHDQSILRLGTLAFDYANPREKRPYIHREVLELLVPPAQATADHRPICYISHRSGWDVNFGAGLEPLLELGASHQVSAYRVVVGQNGSKVELTDPDGFFDNMLAEPTANAWLKTRLSVARKIKAMYKNLVDAPEIWFLTGLYYMEDAVTYSIRSKSKSGNISTSVPIPELTGIAALLGVSAGATFGLGSGCEAEAGAQILGKRVWAAQWRRLHAKYSTDSKSSTTESFQLRLLDLWSSETDRGPEVEDVFVQVSVGDGQGSEELSVEDRPEEEECYSEEIWKVFEDEVSDLLEELEE